MKIGKNIYARYPLLAIRPTVLLEIRFLIIIKQSLQNLLIMYDSRDSP